MITESNVTANDLRLVPLPTHQKPYVTVSHGSIIEETLCKLEEKGFKITEEYYLKNLSGTVASGIYHLEYGDDDDIKLLFSWRNSYDKSKRFSCAIGAHVLLTGGRMISGDISNFVRKHTGDIKDLVKEHIQTQISSAINYYTGLVNDKNLMKGLYVNKPNFYEYVGNLYMKGILTKNQLSIFKEGYENKDFNIDLDKNNLWNIYNNAIVALKVANPSKWVEQHKDLHKLTKDMFFPASLISTVDPNQVDLLDSIEEIAEEDANDLLHGVDNDPESVIGNFTPSVEEKEVINMDPTDYLEEQLTTSEKEVIKNSDIEKQEKQEEQKEQEEQKVLQNNEVKNELTLENYEENIENAESIAPIESETEISESNVSAKIVIIDFDNEKSPIDITDLSKEEVSDLITNDKIDETTDESVDLSDEVTPDINEQIESIIHPDIIEENLEVINEEAAQQVLDESITIQEEIDSEITHLDGNLSELQYSKDENSDEELFPDIVKDVEEEQNDNGESPMLF